MNKIGLLLGVLFLAVSPRGFSEPALQYPVTTMQGDSVNLNEFIGKVVYVDFWASWCGPCRKSFPWMAAMHAKYSEQGLAVVAINVDSDKALAEEFLSKMAIQLAANQHTSTESPIAFNLRFDADAIVAHQFDLQGMPSSFIFNKKGELVQSHVGFFEENAPAYEQELTQLLKD